MGASPGWYPDPHGGPHRYWDGAYWHDAVPTKPGPPTTRTPREKTLMIVLPIVMVAGCGIVLAAGLGGGRSWDDISTQTDAEMACEDAVTARLKHPDVAEFDHRSYIEASGTRPAKVRGVVKTVNGFNAPTRVTYGCEVTGGWVVVTELFEP